MNVILTQGAGLTASKTDVLREGISKLLSYLSDYKSKPRRPQHMPGSGSLLVLPKLLINAVVGCKVETCPKRRKYLHLQKPKHFHWRVTFSLSWAILERLHLHYHTTGWFDFSIPPSRITDIHKHAATEAATLLPRHLKHN